MNNIDINLMKEFRRFVNTHIYPTTAGMIMSYIIEPCDANDISYNPLPQPIIRFHTNIKTQNNLTFTVYGILKNVFIQFFNDPQITKLVKNKIHTEITDDQTKEILRNTFQEIQYGNPQYLSLLFNIIYTNDNYVHLYL